MVLFLDKLFWSCDWETRPAGMTRRTTRQAARTRGGEEDSRPPARKARVAKGSNPIASLLDLPDELLAATLNMLSAIELTAASRTHPTCRALVKEVAERRLREIRPEIPAGTDACPCWLRSVATVEAITQGVGPVPVHD